MGQGASRRLDEGSLRGARERRTDPDACDFGGLGASMTRLRCLQRSIRISAVLTILFAWPLVACGQVCEIDADRVDGARIGASKAVLLEQLSSRYAVTESVRPGATPTLVARQPGSDANSRPLVVINLDGDHAFLIDSYEPCATAEGVGPGVTLAQAQRRYGRGNLDTTDAGYFVWFERKKGVLFLLDDRDIPKSLRRVPDDAMTPPLERQILRIGKARIVAVRVTGPES